MLSTNYSRHLAKVPALTAFFWLIKVLSTTVGETFADYLSTTLGLGLAQTAGVMAVILAVILAIQIAVRRYIAAIYWLAVVGISTFGTLFTDTLHDGLGVENWQSILVFATLLILTLIIWFRREGTLAIKSITSIRRELFYWLAVVLTFALGTAGGDIFLDDLGLPLAITFSGFAVAIIAVGILWKTRILGATAAFWAAYVLSRPLGAALGDLLSQPKSDSGLGLGPTVTTYFFLGAIAVVVGYLSITRRDEIKNLNP